jgi:hypothetical protein
MIEEIVRHIGGMGRDGILQGTELAALLEACRGGVRKEIARAGPGRSSQPLHNIHHQPTHLALLISSVLSLLCVPFSARAPSR